MVLLKFLWDDFVMKHIKLPFFITLFFLGLFSVLLLANQVLAEPDGIVIGGIGPDGEREQSNYVRSPPNCLTINNDPKTRPTLVGDAFEVPIYRSLARFAPDGANYGEIRHISFERVGHGLVSDERTKHATRFYLSMLSPGDRFTYISYTHLIWSHADGLQREGLNRYFDFSYGLAEKVLRSSGDYRLQEDDYRFLAKPLNEGLIKIPSPKLSEDPSEEEFIAHDKAFREAYSKELWKARPRGEPTIEDNASRLGLNILFFTEELGLRDVRVIFRNGGSGGDFYSIELSGTKQ